MKITLTDGTTMEMSVEEYEVFAKITKTAEAAEEEADTLEYDGVTYRKVCGREPEVGDYVVYEESPCIYVKSGKPYVIESIDKWNDPQITDEEGDDYDTANDVFVVYEKVAGETEEKAEAEADELQVGDFGEVTGFSEGSGNPSVKVNGLDQYVFYEELEKVTEPDAKGHTAVVTYADGVTQTLVNVKSIEVTNGRGAIEWRI